MAKAGDTFNIIEQQVKKARKRREEAPGSAEISRMMRSFEHPDPATEKFTSSLRKLRESLGKKQKQPRQVSRQVRGGLSGSDMGALKREKMRVAKERNIKGARAGGLVGKKKVGRHRGDGVARQGLTKGRMA